VAQFEPSFVNQLQMYRPPCSKCGGPTNLVGIEPSLEPGHDLRTFACTACGTVEAITVRFR